MCQEIKDVDDDDNGTCNSYELIETCNGDETDPSNEGDIRERGHVENNVHVGAIQREYVEKTSFPCLHRPDSSKEGLSLFGGDIRYSCYYQ